MAKNSISGSLQSSLCQQNFTKRIADALRHLVVTWWKAELPLRLGFTGRMQICSLISSAVYHSCVQIGKDVQSVHTPGDCGMPWSGITRQTAVLSSVENEVKSSKNL